MHIKKIYVKPTLDTREIISDVTALPTSDPASDARLKRDIELIDRSFNGYNLYRYRYLWSEQLYVGVMAQEILAKQPEAVVEGNDGFLRVKYNKLGLKLQTWERWSEQEKILN